MRFKMRGQKRFSSKRAISRKRANHRRVGMAYVYFLSTMMLVAVIGISALMYARVQRRSAQGADDLMTARLYAQSALERGLAMISTDPNWRTNRGSGAWFTDQSIGDGTFSLDVTILSDADAFPDNDPVLFIGTGVHGVATHKIEMSLEALSDYGGLVISIGSVKRYTG